MVRLSDFVVDRKNFIIWVGGSVSHLQKHCRKMKFRTHIHLTLIRKMFYLVMVEFCGL